MTREGINKLRQNVWQICLFTKELYNKKNGFTKIVGEEDSYSPVLWFHTEGSWKFNNVFGFKNWFCNYTGK